MRLIPLKEPLLEFAQGTHICPKAGIAEHGVYDIRYASRRTSILVGAVGSSTSLEKLHAWIERCTQYIPAQLNNRQPNLFPPFCGFNPSLGFKASLVFHEEISKRIRN
jgi:hypothetical protein